MVKRRRLSGRMPELLLLAVASLLAFGGAELAVRWLAPQALPEGDRYYRADAELGWTLKSDEEGVLSNRVDFSTQVRTNALGLRGGPPAGGHPGVLGVGDSFMFGFGVEEEESFLAVAARRLGGEALNAGVPGYDVCQAVDLAARLLPRLDADAVVLSAFVGNDERDAGEGRGRMVVRDGVFREPGSQERPKSLRRRLLHPIFVRSHLVRLIRFSPLTEALEARLFGKASLRQRALGSLLSTFEDPPPEIVLEGNRLTRECLPRLRRLGEQSGVPVLAVLVPDKLQIYPELLAREIESASLSGRRFDLQAPERRWLRLVAEAGIPVLELLPALREEAAAGRPPYFQADRHFTVEGCRRVGELIADALRGLLATSAS
jgi:hypothetical protein